MSRKTDLNLSIGVDVKKGFEEAVVDIKNNGNKLAGASKQIAQAIGKDYAKAYKSFNASFKETKRQIKLQQSDLGYLTNELKKLNNEAKKYVVVPPKLKGEIREATAALNNQKKSIRELTGEAMAYQEGMKAANMKVGFQEFGNAIEGVARSFQVAQGAAALFGDENEDVMKAMHQMQAVMVFTEGLRGMKHLKTSFELLNQTIKQNPLIAFGVALAAVSVAIYKFSKANDEAYQAQKRQQEITEKAKSSIDKEITTLDNLVAIAKDETIARETRLKAVKSLNETYPDTLKNLRLETIGNQNTTKAILQTKNALLEKAKAQIVQEELVETLREQRKLQKEIDEGKSVSGFFKFIGRGFEQAEDAMAAAKQEVKKLQTELKELTASGGMPDIDLSVGNGKGKTDRPSLFEQDNAQLENQLIDAQNIVKQNYRDGLISKHKYEQEISSIEVMFANRRVLLAEKHNKQTNKLLGISLNKQKTHLDNFATEVKGLPPITLEVDVKTPDLKNQVILPLDNASQSVKKNVSEIDRQVQGLLQTSTENMVANMAVNIANAASANKTIGEAMGDTILVGLSDFLVNMGKMMIAAGITKDLFDKAMTALGGGLVAASAGFSLVLAGSAMKSAMQKNLSPTPLAEGGVLRGTTFGMLAEYPTANNDPEVAIRSSYLRGMIGDAVGGNGGNYIAETKISGRDLYILMKRGQTDYSRG